MSFSSILLGSSFLFTIFEKDNDDYEYSLDVATNESYSFNSETTDTVLQNGSVVSDHIVNKPFDIKISGIVSNTPISLLYFKNTNDAYNFYKSLMYIRDNKILLTISTGLDVYEDMALTAISITRDKDKSKALFVDLSFKRFEIVDISVTDISQTKVNETIQSSTSSPQNKGTVQAKDANPRTGIITKIFG